MKNINNFIASDDGAKGASRLPANVSVPISYVLRKCLVTTAVLASGCALIPTSILGVGPLAAITGTSGQGALDFSKGAKFAYEYTNVSDGSFGSKYIETETFVSDRIPSKTVSGEYSISVESSQKDILYPAAVAAHAPTADPFYFLNGVMQYPGLIRDDEFKTPKNITIKAGTFSAYHIARPNENVRAGNTHDGESSTVEEWYSEREHFLLKSVKSSLHSNSTLVLAAISLPGQSVPPSPVPSAAAPVHDCPAPAAPTSATAAQGNYSSAPIPSGWDDAATYPNQACLDSAFINLEVFDPMGWATAKCLYPQAIATWSKNTGLTP